MKLRNTLVVRQLVIANWSTDDNPETLHYSTLAVGDDGVVYRYDPKCSGWIPWPMDIATCREDHKARR